MPRQIAAGSTVSFGDTSSGTWTIIGDLEKVSEIGQKKPEVKATGLSDTEEVYIGGIKEGQTVTLDIMVNDDAAEQTNLRNRYSNDTVTWFRIKDPRATSINELVFTITLLELSDNIGEGGNIKMLKIAGRISGPIIRRAKTA